MSDKSGNNDQAKKPAAKKRQTGRRPATIDLEATEVRDRKAEAGDQPAADDARPDATGSGATSPGAAAGENNDGAGAEQPGMQDEPVAPNVPERGSRAPGYAMLLVAALAGAVLALGGYVALDRSGLLQRAGVSADAGGRVDDLREEVAALRAGLAQQDDDGLAERLAAIETRLGEMTQARGDAVPVDTKAVEQRLAGAEAQLTLLRNEQDNLLKQLRDASRNADAGAVAALSGRIDTLETRLRERASDIKAQEDDIAALKARLGDVQGTIDKAASRRPESDQRAAMAIAIAGLERAVSSGSSFTRELDVVSQIAGKRSEIETLRPLADKGVARLDELTRSFDAAASQALAAAEPSSGNLMDRLMSSARDIVRVRPTSAVAGDGTGAVLARAEASLRNGDVLAATQELSALDPGPRAAMAGWITRATERLAAMRQVQALSESAMSALRAAPAGGNR